MIIGIAGKYCAGKDTFVEILESYGFYEINADKTGHTVLNQLKTEIVDAFDKKILSPSGEIDRRALGKIVFKKAKYRRKLESIIHPEMIKQIKSPYVAKFALVIFTGLIIISIILLFQRP